MAVTAINPKIVRISIFIKTSLPKKDSRRYQCLNSVIILVGRYSILIPVMAIAESMLTKKANRPSFGILATDTPIFVVLLIGVIVIVGGLTFLPALSLGPIVEQLLLTKGIFF
jgi:K+-transporting ATPase ATPase A chain